MLLEAGHEIHVVENGRDAIEAVLEGDFDVVLMDAHMPEMDGIQATKAIRSLDGEKKNIPIIALTANAMVGDREKYLASGMNDYVSKPFDPDRLLSSIVTTLHGVDINSVQDPERKGSSQRAADELLGEANTLEAEIVDPIRLGKPELWQRLVEIYLKNSPDNLVTIEKSIPNCDFSAIETAAHTLKSSSANLGALQLSDLCQKAETAARETSIEEVQSLFKEMQIEIQNVSSALSESTGVREGNIG